MKGDDLKLAEPAYPKGIELAILALATAICSALGAIILAEVAGRAGGAMSVSRWRTLFAGIALLALAFASGAWSSIQPDHLGKIIASSVLSVVIAEPALNASFVRLGARKTALLFALTAPIASALGWVVLDERFSGAQLIGVILILFGIVLAIAFTPAASAPGVRESGHSHIEQRVHWTAYGYGLLASVGQAGGTLAIRPVMRDDAHPFAVMALRACIAAVTLWGLYLASNGGRIPRNTLPPLKILLAVCLGSAISFVAGMSFMMAALASTPVGIASTLAATTPVVILPMLWLRTGRCPHWLAWVGAAITVAGIMALFL